MTSAEQDPTFFSDEINSGRRHDLRLAQPHMTREGEEKIEHEVLGTPKLQRIARRKQEAVELAAKQEFDLRLAHLREGNGSELGALYVAETYAQQGNAFAVGVILRLIDPERLPVARYHIKPEWDMNELDPITEIDFCPQGKNARIESL